PRASEFTFTKDLKLGMKDKEVKMLQQYLNQKGFTVSLSGPGSFGNETEVFGKATRAALIKFQKANKITPAAGYFGPMSRGVVVF
ncbi:MAG: peptidoglycan-binding protein, partial [Candidatus Pacebacteria bacterium]|nr:peptidoglycan-binding protein [Candidatus Paceibacterota bacterium]